MYWSENKIIESCDCTLQFSFLSNAEKLEAFMATMSSTNKTYYCFITFDNHRAHTIINNKKYKWNKTQYEEKQTHISNLLNILRSPSEICDKHYSVSISIFVQSVTQNSRDKKYVGLMVFIELWIMF